MNATTEDYDPLIRCDICKRRTRHRFFAPVEFVDDETGKVASYRHSYKCLRCDTERTYGDTIQQGIPGYNGPGSEDEE
jgi:hypothetical protein